MDIGAPELAVILAVALLVLGPRKLPHLARPIGEAIHELRTMNQTNTHNDDAAPRRHKRA